MCYLFFFPSFFSTQLSFFSFLPWTGLPRKTEKKKELKKKNLQRGSIRSNSVYEVFFKAFEEKHLSGGGMRPNCSQSLLILPVQSPCRARAGGRRGVPRLGRGGGYRHLALTLCLCSCPLKVGLFSLSHSEAQFRATIWLATTPPLHRTPPAISLLDFLYIFSLLMSSISPIRRLLPDSNWII